MPKPKQKAVVLTKPDASDRPVFFFREHETPYGFMCQWYQSPFHDPESGNDFLCAEQYFMWRKAKQFMDDDSASCILLEKSPKLQKALGRGVQGFVEEEWDAVRLEVCERVCMLKFTQCVTREDDGNGARVELMRLLLETGEREIFEASPFDKVWGIGVRANVAQHQVSRKEWGQNLLGKCLMKTRRVLRAREQDTPPDTEQIN